MLEDEIHLAHTYQQKLLQLVITYVIAKAAWKQLPLAMLYLNTTHSIVLEVLCLACSLQTHCLASSSLSNIYWELSCLRACVTYSKRDIVLLAVLFHELY